MCACVITGKWKNIKPGRIIIVEEDKDKVATYTSWNRYWYHFHGRQLRWIWAMVTAPDGSIWVAGESGFIAYWDGGDWVDGGQWCHREKAIIDLTVASDGSIWALSKDDNYTARWDGNKWEDRGKCCINMDYRFLFIAPDGSIQALNDKGYAVRWNGKKWEEIGRWFTSDGGWLIHDAVTATDGNVWVAGLNGVTACWDGDEWKEIYLRFHRPGGGGDMNVLIVTPDGIIWVGGDEGYLAYWNGDKWINCERWFCEEKGIMQKISDLVIDYISPLKDDDEGNEAICSCIQALTVAPDGSIWAVASGNYIARWVYKVENQLLNKK